MFYMCMLLEINGKYSNFQQYVVKAEKENNKTHLGNNHPFYSNSTPNEFSILVYLYFRF